MRYGLLLVTLLFSHWATALSFELPKNGSNIVGKIQYHEVQKGESIADIADKYNVGFLALMAANKGVDPFLPDPGYVLTIPTEIILPPYPYQGIVVNLAELRLYYFEPDKGIVHIFPIGIGRIGRDTPEMETTIVQKRPNPTWTPTQTIRDEYLKKGVTLPDVVPAGKDNPLGLFALRLGYGYGEYLIHGTNKDFGIGLRVSSGCIRMNPPDIEWLFKQVHVGQKVRVINEPIKVSLEPDHSVVMEVHEPLTRSDGVKVSLHLPKELSWWLQAYHYSDSKAKAAIVAQNGVPLEVAE
jgi:L,D-transpeptidase YcfS